MQREFAHLLAQQAKANAHRGECDAGDGKQEGDADRERMRVVAGIFRPASGDESVGRAEHDGEDHERADGEGQPWMAAAETAKVQFDPESPPHRQ
jgi:hypothetical protein